MVIGSRQEARLLVSLKILHHDPMIGEGKLSHHPAIVQTLSNHCPPIVQLLSRTLFDQHPPFPAVITRFDKATTQSRDFPETPESLCQQGAVLILA